MGAYESADLREIREETTGEVLEYITETPQLLKAVRDTIDNAGGIRKRTQAVKSYCEHYATEHNGNFGELFIAELDLVYWSRLIDRLQERRGL